MSTQRDVMCFFSLSLVLLSDSAYSNRLLLKLFNFCMSESSCMFFLKSFFLHLIIEITANLIFLESLSSIHSIQMWFVNEWQNEFLSSI